MLELIQGGVGRGADAWGVQPDGNVLELGFLVLDDRGAVPRA